jgi:DNA-binding protein Fis
MPPTEAAMGNSMDDVLHVAVDAWKQLWEQGKAKQLTKQSKKSKKQKSKKTIRRGKRETLTNYYERTLKGQNQDDADVEEFADHMQPKRDDVFRVGFQNISNLSEQKNTAKSRQSISYIVQKQYDVFMMAEVGLAWKLVALGDQWFKRVFGKFRSICSCFAYNKTEMQQTTVLQSGGVGIIGYTSRPR